MDTTDDNRPLALRRKRRASSALVKSEDKEVNHQQAIEETTVQDAPREPPKTPGNRKKRIRFSDSVIEIGAGSTTNLTTAASSSTGLTPALNRTILIPVKSMDKVKKRLSLPEQLMTPASSRSSTGSPLSASPIEIQFAPLVQKISDRTMRRLKRNHLSETTNEIQEENKKSKKGLQQEVERLRDELALVRQQNNETNAAANTAGAAHDNTERIEQLENELSGLKQEMREQSTTMDHAIPEALQNGSSVSPPLLERVSASPPLPDEGHDFNDTGLASESATNLTGTESQSEIPESLSAVSFVEASTQTPLPQVDFSEVFRSARLEYEQLFPGETPMGLEIVDPVPLIQTIISRVESLKKETDRLNQEYTVKETSRLNMKNNFDRALTQLEHIRTQIRINKAKIDEEKDRARTAEFEISTLEARVENAESKNKDMKKQRDDHQRSIERLQDAIEHYRSEAEELTRTILQIESSHNANMAKLRSEYQASNAAALVARDVFHEDKVSDLEAEIDSEKIGRLKAEESAVKRLDRIRELGNREGELRSTINQKQAIIRQLETQIEQTKSGHENEVGQLNVRIGELVSNLSSASAELAKVRQETTRLSDLVEQEKAAGLKAVESMQTEVKQCANKVDAVKDGHAKEVKKRGEEVALSFGLITPVVEGGRFRDAEADEKVEGHVELLRGKATKKRPDSGVGLWDPTIEEEEEEDVDGDVVMEDPDENIEMATESHALGLFDELM
ncbi:hypothetical protein XPA_002673 [Xanthoria parietina]